MNKEALGKLVMLTIDRTFDGHYNYNKELHRRYNILCEKLTYYEDQFIELYDNRIYSCDCYISYGYSYEYCDYCKKLCNKFKIIQIIIDEIKELREEMIW